MGCRKTWILGAALCGALLCGANSQAGSISYLATGTFTTSGTSVYTSPDALTSVSYTSEFSTVTVPPPSIVSLGTFTTASTSSSPITVSDTFTLTVTNTATLRHDYVHRHDERFDFRHHQQRVYSSSAHR